MQQQSGLEYETQLLSWKTGAILLPSWGRGIRQSMLLDPVILSDSYLRAARNSRELVMLSSLLLYRDMQACDGLYH